MNERDELKNQKDRFSFSSDTGKKPDSYRKELSRITKEDVVKIITDIDRNGIPPRMRSAKYDLSYEGKAYPVKYVLSAVYKKVTGKTMTYGGHDETGREYLTSLGFGIQAKEKNLPDFYPVIQKFIHQANHDQLKATGYPKRYQDLRVEIHFGKGYNFIPQINLLYDEQTTLNGIYPAFLYYREQKMIILAFGVSESRKVSQKWDLPENTMPIETYFSINRLGNPKRHGNSFVFKVYSPTSEIDPSRLNADLNEIISIYKKIMSRNGQNDRVASTLYIPFNIHRTVEIRKTGLFFGKDILYRYAISLLAKPFVILSGLSGSGKTRLALTFAKWLSDNDSQVKIISVGADWNNREYLLGCPNALDPGTYIQPENGILNFLLEAVRNPSRPYFLILDEMNLSYVERYFADFLSAMESNEPIHLHPDAPNWDPCNIPPEIKLPPNLFITGTINVDETTYMFSPKVLDRANVIEFRIGEEEMNEFLVKYEPLQHDAVNCKGADMAGNFVLTAHQFDRQRNLLFHKILLSFFTAMKQAGAEFGYRTASEIFRFISLSQQLNTGWDNDQLTDIVVMQKMLPKLHGSRKKILPVLHILWALCLQPDMEPVLIENDTPINNDRFRYPLSATKIRQMYRNAKDNGFTSYAEA